MFSNIKTNQTDSQHPKNLAPRKNPESGSVFIEFISVLSFFVILFFMIEKIPLGRSQTPRFERGWR